MEIMYRETVNNEQFYKNVKKYLIALKKNPDLIIPDSIGRDIYILVYNLSFNRKFINYTYKDSMISEAIYMCLRYLDRFNYKKYKNPFAYFTMISYNAFIQIIKKEKKQSTIKQKLLERNYYDIIGNNCRKLNLMNKNNVL